MIKVGAAWKRFSRWVRKGAAPEPADPSFLLMESGGFLLKEDGDKFIKQV